MKQFGPIKRKFLFLQGPPGPFFWLLGQELKARGHDIFRINLNGGDNADWPSQATHYRGGQNGWNRFVDRFIRDNRITDILLFGDCRPHHLAAHGMAKLRGINIHVFEEGYIRPHWVTMEPDGVNGYSTLSRDPEWLIEQARHLPSVPAAIPITASFGRRAKDALRYYTAVCVNRWRYPLYRSHRPGSVILEGIGWLIKFARQRIHSGKMEPIINSIGSSPYFLFPLQLGSDYQIRTHSPFRNMRDAAIYVMESFALHAPHSSKLVIKEHPLDCEFRSWNAFVRKHARRLRIEDRVIHVAGGDLATMAQGSLGMVTVNSTSGTLGLEAGRPVFVLGSAIYDIPGITHQGRLDGFWGTPSTPDAEKYEAFCKVLHARCLISGGFASKSAIDILIQSTLARLLLDPAHLPIDLQVSKYMERIISRQAAAEVSAVSVSATATG